MEDNSNHWITYHWPHPIPDDHPWAIFRQVLDKRDYKLRIGDKVLFYVGQRPHLRGQSGERARAAVRVQGPCRTGPFPLSNANPGIIRAGVVISPPRPIGTQDILYDYKQPDPRAPTSAYLGEFKYITDCRAIGEGGPVTLENIRDILEKRIPPQALQLLEISCHEYAAIVGNM